VTRAVLVVAIVVAPLAAQQPERLQASSPVVVRTLDSLLALADAQGLPREPLIQKAIEGTAKGAPPERIVGALGVLLARLHAAADALRRGGITPNASTIEAGAFALSAGLDSGSITALARAGSAAGAVDVTLRVGGTLAAIGVPSAQVLELVTQALRSGDPPAALLAMPGRVQSAIARGATPAAAAAAAAGNRGRGVDGPPRGPPPDRGPPPGKGPPAGKGPPPGKGPPAGKGPPPKP
jgi:hypothetical protein